MLRKSIIMGLTLAIALLSNALPALAQDPTPTPTPSSSGLSLNFRDYVKIDSLRAKISDTTVMPRQVFNIDMQTDITWIGDPDPPMPISFLKNWSAIAMYEIAAIRLDDAGEIKLGKAEITLGPFPSVKTGDKFSFAQHVETSFSADASLGKYRIVVRPVGMRGGFLNAFAAAWPLIKGTLPQEYAIGDVTLAVPPTPTATPVPTPTPTPEPTVTPGPLDTPTPTATAEPAPTDTPPPTIAPATPDEPSRGVDWLPAGVGIALGLAAVGVVAGVSLRRRGHGPKGG